jgi:hypothetical protein
MFAETDSKRGDKQKQTCFVSVFVSAADCGLPLLPIVLMTQARPFRETAGAPED